MNLTSCKTSNSSDIFVLAFYKRATNKEGICEGRSSECILPIHVFLYDVYPEIVCEFV